MKVVRRGTPLATVDPNDGPLIGGLEGPDDEREENGIAVAVKLKDVLEAMEYPGEWECYMNPSTGEIIPITDEEREYVDDPDADISHLPDWLQESVLKGREAMESPDIIALPSKFDVHEWGIMRRYADSREEPVRSDLLDAIHGKGAFFSAVSQVHRPPRPTRGLA